MKKNINFKKILINSLAAFVVLFPNFVFSAGLVTCDGPDCDWSQFLGMIKEVINFAVAVGIALSALVFAWAGWLYMSSGGDEGKIKEAHGIFTKVLWGFLFALGAYLIVQLILTSLGADTTGIF
jgi:hypothetical protein